MSDYQNLDLRSPQARRAEGGALRGILITLGVVLVIFALLAALGAGTRDGETVAPAVQNEMSAPAVESQQSAPAATQPVDN